MHQHLRLARARGSLQAPNSVVQDYALEILDMLDESVRETQRIDMVKTLLASVPMERVKDYFPEYFRPDPLAEAIDPVTGEFDIDKVDDSKIDWQTAGSEDEDADLSAWIEEQERKSGGVTTFSADEWI